MASKFISKGDTIDYTPASDVTAGTLVEIGADFYGVADRAIPASAVGALTVKGVYQLPAAAGVTVGAAVYWDATNAKVTATATTGKMVGKAVSATADGSCLVLLG